MIELKNLCAGYGGEFKIRDITAAFPSGELTVLIGPNGSGKTTLLRAAAGLLHPSSGAVLLDGLPLKSFSARRAAQKIAFLPQSRVPAQLPAERLVLHGRFPYLSCPRRYRPEDREIARRALEQTGALELATKSVASLSGGERQKVYLAMAIAQDADTVLLDEPTTYLDIRHQLELMACAGRMKEQGKAVVMVLHDLNLALRCADRVLLLQNGLLCACGAPEEMVHSGALSRAFGVRVEELSSSFGPWYGFDTLCPDSHDAP